MVAGTELTRRARPGESPTGLAGLRLARLVRFYHLDPRVLASLPEWLFAPLEEHIATLRVEETQRALAVMLAPHSKDMQRILHAEAEEIYSRLAGPAHEQGVVENDPEKAAEWFASIGAEVVQ